MEIKNRFSVSARRMKRSIIRELLKLAIMIGALEKYMPRLPGALIKKQV